MKIVIDIPEKEYKRMIEKSLFGTVDVWKRAIKHGTPLPKGHGDLIDRKELTKYPPIWMEDKRRTGEDDAVILLSDILKAEAIIEADTAEREDVVDLVLEIIDSSIQEQTKLRETANYMDKKPYTYKCEGMFIIRKSVIDLQEDKTE